jgi:hypothetical protein
MGIAMESGTKSFTQKFTMRWENGTVIEGTARFDAAKGTWAITGMIPMWHNDAWTEIVVGDVTLSPALADMTADEFSEEFLGPDGIESYNRGEELNTIIAIDPDQTDQEK